MGVGVVSVHIVSDLFYDGRGEGVGIVCVVNDLFYGGVGSLCC